MKKSILSLLVAASAALVPFAHAADLYWDTNGSTLGAGSGNGTWGSDSFWNTLNTGGAGTFTTALGSGNVGIFSAGNATNSSTGIYTVNVSGTQASGGLTMSYGTPTLTGGTIALGANKAITAALTLAGTATIESALTVDTTAGGAITLGLTANDAAGATDLLIKGGISATTPANTYQIRLGGTGSGRIEGAISNHGGSLTQGSTTWTGTWTIAGNQSLGSTSVTLGAANNKLIMGDSLSDVQSWSGATNVTSSSALMTVKSSATSAGISLRGAGGTLDVVGSLNSTGFTFGVSGTNDASQSGILKLSGGNASFSGVGSAIVVHGTGSKIIGGAASYGTLTMNQTSAVNLTGNLTLGGSGTNENNFNLVKANTNTLTLSGENTFSGSTTVNGGTLALGNNLALQNSAIDTAGAGNMTLTVTAPTVGGLIGSKSLASVMTTGYSSVTALTLNPISGGNYTYSGVIANGAMAIAKSGAGTQVLSGNNTYSGGTTISAGTLLVSNTAGSGLGSGAVTVNGGTLGGAGSFTGDVTVNAGGTLAPGSSIESLGAGGITLTGGTFAFELNTTASTADLLYASDATVALTLTTGVPTLTITDLGSNAVLSDGTKFTLISYTAAGGWNNGIFSGYANGSEFTLGSNTWQINYADTSAGSNFNSDAVLFGDRFVTITVVPEPSTWALLACSLTVVMVLRRRRSV